MFSNRDLRRLLIPLVLEQLLSSLMGITDTIMVTRVGDSAISAVSCVDAINTLVLYLVSALSAGGTIVCSQYLGRKDRKQAVSAAQQVYLVAVGMSVLLSAIALIFRRGLLVLIFGQVEEDILSQAMDYLLITAFSYPFLALAQTSSAQFRVGGNARMPMLVTALANCINIGGNALLIFGFDLGVFGAGLSTLCCRIFTAAVLLICQRNPKLPIPMRAWRSIRPNAVLIRLICQVAIPTGIENALFQLGRLLVQSTVATLGTTAIAAQAMISTLDTLQSTPGVAIGLGLLTVAGQCMGAGKPEEARRYARKHCVISWCVVAAGVAIILPLAPTICRLSGLSAEASQLTFRLLMLISGVKLVLWVPAFTLPNTLRAAGDVAFTAALSGASMWVFRVGCSALLCRVLGIGLAGIWIAWFADWLCRVIAYILRYRSDCWTHRELLGAAGAKRSQKTKKQP